MSQTQNALGRLYAHIPDNRVQTSKHGVVSHKAEARDESRKLISVDVFPSNGMSVGGQYAKQGKSVVVIYASELEGLMARVASDEQKSAWRDAERAYQTALSRYLDTSVGKPPSNDRTSWPQEYIVRRERAEKMFGETTVALEYSRRFPGGRPPLTELTVIEDLPAPTTAENRDRTRMESLLTSFVETLGKASAVAAKGQR